MKGVREQYELGKYLRQRYDGFLSKAYHASQIYVRSSSFNRAIMSASANMAGLFEPEGDQLWNKQIRWQPVPIQVVPKENDPMLWTKRPCPAATQLFEDFKKSSSDLRRIEQKYARLLTFLGQKTGLNRTLQLYNDVYDVFDLLNCQRFHKKTQSWPKWMNVTIFKELAEVYDSTVTMTFPTFEIQRLRGGIRLLLGDILSRMRNQTLHLQNKIAKFYAYSAHDSTIAALFNNLGAMQPHAPPYAALLMIELHQINNQHFVEA
uniref:Lysosomal acid phosphatase n=1 Tax=Plectus sambesii TaxID=2011161 RepID=A0A914WZ45_9BILA